MTTTAKSGPGQSQEPTLGSSSIALLDVLAGSYLKWSSWDLNQHSSIQCPHLKHQLILLAHKASL